MSKAGFPRGRGRLRVAIVHHWFVAYRGGEKVIEELCALFPEADLFAHVVDKSVLPPSLVSRKIATTWINSLPFAKRLYKNYLPLMPLALEQLDLRGYDLVLSCESGPAKGVITSPETLHICYCNTPMRYVWDMYHDYLAQSGRIKRFLMAPLLHYLRIWDRLSADRVDHFIANSGNVARRIFKHYRRKSDVVYPPVDVDAFFISEKVEDFYLMVGQLVGYKRTDLVVKAFARSGKRLIVIGDGEQMSMLRKIAGANITLMGWQPEDVLRDHYARCRALIFPGEEDFGIVPVEAMASGRPVIAYGRGGALETVVEGLTGLFFHEQTEEAVLDAVIRFEGVDIQFAPSSIRNHALKFSKEVFRSSIMSIVLSRLASCQCTSDTCDDQDL